jgi:hypothetical protein
MKNRLFKVGDEIICIKDHSRKLVRNGEVFTVKGFTRNPCCGSTIVDVGISDSTPHTTCYTCQCDYKKPNGGYWFAAYLFRKIEESSSTAKDKLPEAIQERIRKHKKTTLPELIEA